MTTPSSRVERGVGPGRHDPRSTWLTYESFYGLTEKPFSLSSDPRFFYHSASHTPAFDELLAGILRRESLSVLTGDIGMGKTTLCRAVIESLDRKTFSAIVPDPFASREDLLKVLLMDFGVMSIDDLTSGRLKGATRTELSYLLYEFLDTLAPLEAFAVVIIDEAQNISVSLLEEIRILSDSDGRDRQLQVVLVGQLELRDKLMLPEMRQVDQRVSVRSTLDALNRDGVAGYITHRLRVAGASSGGVRFTSDAIDRIYRQSGGVPRLINRICDRALYEGYLRRAGSIDEALVESVISGVPAAAPEMLADAPPLAPAISISPEIAPAIAMEIEPEIEREVAPEIVLEIVDEAPEEIAEEAASEVALEAALELPTIIEFAIQVDDDAAPAEQAVPDEFSLNTDVIASRLSSGNDLRPHFPRLEDGEPALTETTLDEPAREEPLRRGPPPPLEWSRPGSIVFPREVTPTSAQQFRRRWASTFVVGALCMMGLGVMAAGRVYLQTMSVELAAPTRLPRLPAAPPPPAMPKALVVPDAPDAGAP